MLATCYGNAGSNYPPEPGTWCHLCVDRIANHCTFGDTNIVPIPELVVEYRH